MGENTSNVRDKGEKELRPWLTEECLFFFLCSVMNSDLLRGEASVGLLVNMISLRE